MFVKILVAKKCQISDLGWTLSMAWTNTYICNGYTVIYIFVCNTLQMLDGVTLTNLDIVPNGVDVPLEGSLLDQVDNCCTAFGW